MGLKAQYTVKSGDRISRIATKYQVTSQEIISANPSIFTPDRLKKASALILDGTLNPGETLIYAGEVLNIPSGTIDNIIENQTVTADKNDDLTIYLDGEKLPNPLDFEYTEYFDACSDSFSFSYPHETGIPYKLKIKPENFKSGLPSVRLYIGGESVLTGDVEIPGYKVSTAGDVLSLAGRSKTYLLEKSDVFPDVQREFLKLDALQIAQIVCSPFGLSVVADSAVGNPFEKVILEDNENAFSFLRRIASERGLLVGKNSNGEVRLFKAILAPPVALFNIDHSFIDFLGVDAFEFVYDTTKLFGQYVGKGTNIDDVSISESVPSSAITQNSVKIFDYQDADTATIGVMTSWEEQKAIRGLYANSIPYPSWINPKTGKRWKAGQTITINCPAAMITNKVMLINSIVFSYSGGKKIATLSIIPAETYA